MDQVLLKVLALVFGNQGFPMEKRRKLTRVESGESDDVQFMGPTPTSAHRAVTSPVTQLKHCQHIVLFYCMSSSVKPLFFF